MSALPLAQRYVPHRWVATVLQPAIKSVAPNRAGSGAHHGCPSGHRSATLQFCLPLGGCPNSERLTWAQRLTWSAFSGPEPASAGAATGAASSAPSSFFISASVHDRARQLQRRRAEFPGSAPRDAGARRGQGPVPQGHTTTCPWRHQNSHFPPAPSPHQWLFALCHLTCVGHWSV